MPMSNISHLPAVMHFVCTLQPSRILDVGIGMGTYGFLLRQYLEISKDRLRKSKWEIRIEGVEIFEGYRTPVWNYAYDRVLIGDIRVLAKDLGSYDVVLCNDILEHLERKEARSVIGQLLARSAVLIATTPNRKIIQGVRTGNIAERHLSFLNDSDFSNLVVRKVTGVTNLYVCCSDKSLFPILKEAAITCPSCQNGKWTYLKWRVKRKLIKQWNLFTKGVFMRKERSHYKESA